MRAGRMCLAILTLALVGATEVAAQVSDASRVAAQREELERIRELEAEIPEIQGTTWDYGGWYRFSFTKFDDAITDREAAEHDVRLWASLSFADLHQFYVRVRTAFVDWARHDQPFGLDPEDVEGPSLDQGWYRVRLARLAEKYGSPKWPCDVDLKLGRQYLEIGRGVVFSRIFDAAILEGGNFYFNAQLFAGQTFSSNRNIDTFAPKWWHDDRTFAGFQASMTNVIPRVEPYVYGLWVNDRNDFDGGVPGQGYGYDPRYLAVGARGNPWGGLRWWAEYIQEGGRSATAGSTRREKIDAHAFIAGGEYVFADCYSRPRFEVEYGLASGDGDRASPIHATLGNTAFTKDKGFLAYGYHDTGVAFAGRFANLSVLRADASFRPLEFVPCLRELEVGAAYYWFRKDKAAGGISDLSASNADKDIGAELDLYANWRITSDLMWTVRWGRFNLGKAYVDPSDTREYVLTTITYSF